LEFEGRKSAASSPPRTAPSLSPTFGLQINSAIFFSDFCWVALLQQALREAIETFAGLVVDFSRVLDRQQRLIPEPVA